MSVNKIQNDEEIIWIEIQSILTPKKYYYNENLNKIVWNLKYNETEIDSPDGFYINPPIEDNLNEFNYNLIKSKRISKEGEFKKIGSNFQIKQNLENINTEILTDRKFECEKFMEIPYFPDDLLELHSYDSIISFLFENLTIQKKGSIFTQEIRFEDLIKPNKTELSGPILKSTDPTQKNLCISLFRSIKNYLNKKDQTSLLNITKLIDGNPNYLVDEVIVQLITEANTIILSDHSVNAWHLLLFISARYRISNQIRQLLRSFSLLSASCIDNDIEIKELSTLCLLRSSSSTPFFDGVSSNLSIPEYFNLCISYTTLYGFTLSEILWKEQKKTGEKNQLIPNIIKKIINKIKKIGGLKHEGIFRVPGLKSDQTLIINKINKGDWEIDNKNINTVASLLPKFFMTLRDPIIPFQLIQNMDIDSPSYKCLELINSLSNENRETLKYFIGFLQELLLYESKTLMNINNFRISFGSMLSNLPTPTSLAEVQNDLNATKLGKLFIKLITYWNTNDIYDQLPFDL